MPKNTWSNYKRTGIWVDPPLFFQNSHIFPFFLQTSLILIMFILMMMTLIILSRKCSMTTFIHIWYKFPAILIALSEAVIVFKVVFHSKSIPIVDLVLETLKKADHNYLSILGPDESSPNSKCAFLGIL